jgi:hypothetical protein
MLTREQTYRTIEKLPECFPIEQLIEQLVFVEKVERGLFQSQKGQINSKEQTKVKLSKWLN